MALALRAQAGNEIQTVDYLPWLIVDQDNISPDDIATAQLTLMRIQSAGSIVALDGAETTVTPLVYTTTQSMLIDQLTLLRRANPFDLLSGFVASGVRQTLAARVVGPANTAFPDGPPPVPAPEGNATPLPTPRPVRAIEKSGKTAECFQCLDCQVEYYDDHRCPPLAKQRKVRERAAKQVVGTRVPSGMPIPVLDRPGAIPAMEPARGPDR